MNASLKKHINRMLREYYALLGIESDDANTKKPDAVMARSAMISALYGHFSQADISKIMKMHRSVISRRLSSHKDDIAGYRYEYMYSIAKSLVEDVVKSNPEDMRQSYMDGMVEGINYFASTGMTNYAKAMIDSYESKLALGWPKSTKRIVYNEKRVKEAI